MHTREGATVSAPVRTHHTARLVGGMGRATLTALWALVGSAVLIAVGAVLSICWDLHPLLMVGVAAVMVWLGTRIAGYAFRTGR